MKKSKCFGWLINQAALLFMALALLAFLGGCASVNPFSDSSKTTMDLDGEQQFSAEVEPGTMLVLDMRNPGSGGYQFVGASFDPNVVELSGFWTEEPTSGLKGDFGRAKYQFRALAEGRTVIEIRIKRPWEEGSAPEVYKAVQVQVVP